MGPEDLARWWWERLPGLPLSQPLGLPLGRAGALGRDPIIYGIVCIYGSQGFSGLSQPKEEEMIEGGGACLVLMGTP